MLEAAHVLCYPKWETPFCNLMAWIAIDVKKEEVKIWKTNLM